MIVTYRVSLSRTCCSIQHRVGFSFLPACRRALDSISASEMALTKLGGRSCPSRDDLRSNKESKYDGVVAAARTQGAGKALAGCWQGAGRSLVRGW